jgi:hypothetical protein
MAQLASIDVEIGLGDVEVEVGEANRSGEATSPVLGPALPQAIATQTIAATSSEETARTV